MWNEHVERIRLEISPIVIEPLQGEIENITNQIKAIKTSKRGSEGFGVEQGRHW
jgi:hypothetical protein